MSTPALIMAILTCALLAAGCGAEATSGDPEAAGRAIGREEAHGHAAAAEPEAGHVHGAGAEGEAAEVSDLDRPLAELFREECEHGVRTYQCDECRYEVGVVRVPQEILDGGLVRTASAGRRRVESPVRLTGEVRFDERRVAHLSSPAEGIIRGVRVQPGQAVAAGQILLEIDSRELGEAQGDYLEARATLALAEKSRERQSALRREEIASEREYLEAVAGHEAALIRAKTATERLLRLGLGATELEALQGDSLGQARGRLLLRSPLDGTVAEMHAVSGEAAAPGESIVTVGDLGTLWVLADLYEQDLAAVMAAMAGEELPAVVTVSAFPGEEFAGRLELLGPSMDRETRTLKARVSVANSGGRLRPGMFAEVRLLLPSGEEALALPREAILEDEGRSFVFLRHDREYFVRRPVTTGRDAQGWVEVKEGLSGGEEVAADGGFLLKSDVLRSKMGAGCAD